MEEKRIIEVGGVKMEVDLRTATIVDQYRVGQYVKVLVKDYSSYKSFIGQIIGFDNFKNLPTITIIYVQNEYNHFDIKFCYINSESKDLEICPLNKVELPFSKAQFIDFMQKEIEKKRREADEVESKLKLFLTTFDMYFKVPEKTEE